jgi:putative phosphoesterase
VRVALLSDTHGVIDPRLTTELVGCDLIVHAGDVGAAGVIAELERHAPRVVAVRGNNDVPGKWPKGERAALEALPLEVEIDLPGGKLVVLHGHDVPPPVCLRHDRLRTRFGDARAIVYGHSHRRVQDTTKRPWVLNPGAAGRQRTYGGPSLLLLEAADAGWVLSEVRLPPG